jgi:hypothetical protein
MKLCQPIDCFFKSFLACFHKPCSSSPYQITQLNPLSVRHLTDFFFLPSNEIIMVSAFEYNCKEYTQFSNPWTPFWHISQRNDVGIFAPRVHLYSLYCNSSSISLLGSFWTWLSFAHSFLFTRLLNMIYVSFTSPSVYSECS